MSLLSNNNDNKLDMPDNNDHHTKNINHHTLNTFPKCNQNKLNHKHDHNLEMNHSNTVSLDANTDTNTDTMDDYDNKTVSPDSPKQELKAENNSIIEDWRALKELSIQGTKCKLVPYTVDHVPTYNKWLNDPHIQQMTQTEPYSLDQEYEYQKEWKSDETKYIFIILDKTLNKTLNNAMCGDINIFIQQNESHEHIGELNIMIAEESSRRKGIATETLQLIIKFARKYLEILTFVAKISSDNQSSIELFKKIGFKQTDFIDAFKEYTFTLSFEENNKVHLNSQCDNDKLKFKQDNIHTD